MVKPAYILIFALLLSILSGCSVANTQPQTDDIRDRKVLVIMTNHSEYPSRSDTTGLWLTELTHFVEIVEAEGYETVFASPRGGRIPLDERSLGWPYMDDKARDQLTSLTFVERIRNTRPISEIEPSDFDAIYFTGGHGVMWDFPDNEDLRRVAESIYLQGGVISAVCHGVAGLINLEGADGQPIIKDRLITGFSNTEEFFSGVRDQVPFFLEDELIRKGAVYDESWIPFKSFVLTDDRIITGQNPASAAAVAEALVSLLSSLDNTY